MRFDFEKISVKGVKRWKAENGKPRQCTKEFWQTLNPFNKNADGTVKTRQQIVAEIKAARDAWMLEPHK